MKPVVIIGSGLGGYSLAREFRKLDKETPLTILTRDDGQYYSKPLLSNALTKDVSPDRLATADAEAMADQLQAQIRTGIHITALDPEHAAVECDDHRFAYHRLVLALGADPVRPPLAGNAGAAVLSVNDLQDYARFRSAIRDSRRIVILGGGLIGCEFANDLVNREYAVDVIDPNPAPLHRLIPEPAGNALARVLADRGVCWHFNCTASRIDHAATGLQLTLNNGTTLRADNVLAAVGLQPRTTLATGAGLSVGRGITTDRLLQASAAGVYALGDCAEVDGLLLPFVMPIMHAARSLAKTLTGTPTRLVYPVMPVVVKTPAYPVIAAPPPADVSGEWDVESSELGIRAQFHDREGRLRGFALTGTAITDKAELMGQLSPLLA